jgi:hypothetical protein
MKENEREIRKVNERKGKKKNTERKEKYQNISLQHELIPLVQNSYTCIINLLGVRLYCFMFVSLLKLNQCNSLMYLCISLNGTGSQKTTGSFHKAPDT